MFRIFDSYGIPSILSRISKLCIPCNRFLHKTWFLWVTMHALQQSLCTPCKGKVSCYLSWASGSKQILSTHSLRSVCTPFTHSTEEKQLKLILTFTASLIHNKIHLFIHENATTENCKQCSHYALDQISFVLFISENGYNCDKNNNWKLKNLLLTCS